MPKQADLNWSSKQGRILTGDGELARLYTPERGFPFAQVRTAWSWDAWCVNE
jgi:hypothetical protein